jgi:hypothetical protein
MSDFQHIDRETADRLAALADRARTTLIAAGIHAFDIGAASPQGGAAIEVDTGADESGGVYISWTFSRELNDEMGRYLLSNQLSHPMIKYSGKVRLAMRDAIIAILNAAEFSAMPAEDDGHPLGAQLCG